MQDYNFWQDVLETYRALPVMVQICWVLMPPGFILIVMGIWAYYRVHIQMLSQQIVYTPKEEYIVQRDQEGLLRLRTHERDGEIRVLRQRREDAEKKT